MTRHGRAAQTSARRRPPIIALVALLLTGLLGAPVPAGAVDGNRALYDCPSQTVEIPPLDELLAELGDDLPPGFELPSEIALPPGGVWVPVEVDGVDHPVLPNSTVEHRFRTSLQLDDIVQGGVDLDEIPFPIVLEEIRIVFALPEGVTVTGFSGSNEFFEGSHRVEGRDLVLSFATETPIEEGETVLDFPELRVEVDVGSRPRIIEWTMPTLIEAQVHVRVEIEEIVALLDDLIDDLDVERVTAILEDSGIDDVRIVFDCEPDHPAPVMATLRVLGERTAAESFVTAAYVDYVGREPTTAELRYGVAMIGDVDSSVARGRFSRTLSESEVYVGAFVDRLYRDTLGRPSDAGGRAHWHRQLSSGAWTPAEVGAYFYASPEYFNGIGRGQLEVWVRDLYRKVLLRSADAEGVNHWVSVARRRGRQAVAHPMYQSRESSRKRVTALYEHFLGRGPDAAGLDHWGGAIPKQGDLALAVQLTRSAEYLEKAKNRFP